MIKIISNNPVGLSVQGARMAGERAVIALGNARNNRQRQNPYLGRIDNTVLKDPELYKSELGTSVVADVTFGDPNNPTVYTDNNGNEITLPVMKFSAILVTVSFPRRIVKTEIQGRNGTVKEYIGEDDAQVNFRGVITGQNGVYPLAEVASLKQIIKAPVPIPVICTFLQNLDIDTIVFEDREISQDEGGYSYQGFSLNAISDVPVELQISNI